MGKAKNKIAVLVAVVACVLLTFLLWPFDAAPYLAMDSSAMMLDRNGKPMNVFLNAEEQWCFPRGLGQVSPKIIEATLAVEDQRFYLHPGVDPIAICRAAWQNIWQQRTVSGASTLTMQIVKQHEGAASGVVEKFLQMAQALRLDARVDKDALLAAYLNTAPYGRNLLGVEAAARRYFGKPAQELTLAEAALIAGLPQSPTAYDPIRNPDAARARRDIVLGRMLAEGYIAQEAYVQAVGGDLGVAWHEFPQDAPHLAMKLRGNIEESGTLETTLDADLQEFAHSALKKNLNRFPHEVSNGAVMLVHLPSGEIRARVASQDFFETQGGGQVDLCDAPRSPGSTLKPFTYALAMQQQKLYPSEILLDDTLDFGAYNPANFDGKFNGLVTATEALRFSLNVPAVMVLQRVQVAEYCEFLEGMHFSTITKTPEHYGLGLTLGNCEVKLEEMMAAYAMLARGGRYQALRILKDEAVAQDELILSPGIAHAVCDMLRQPFPNDVETGLVKVREDETPVCWKTGTSTGFHDAWAFAFDETWLVGVWLGNNDGRASRQLVGAWAALPLAAELIRSLPRDKREGATGGGAGPTPPILERQLWVCAETGLPQSDACPSPVLRAVPKELYLNRRCAVHSAGSQNTGVERWPSSPLGWDLAAIIQQKQTTKEKIKEEKQSIKDRNLLILSPSGEAEFILSGEPTGDQIQLAATRDNTDTLHWYLDGKFLGSSTPAAPLFWKMRAGTHKLSCMSESGLSDSVEFSVAIPKVGERVES